MTSPGAEPKVDRSIGALLASLASETGLLLRQEIELLKAEVHDKYTHQARAAVMLAAGGLALFSGWLVLLAAATLALAKVMAPWAAALAVAGATLIIGYVVVRVGIHRLRREDLVPHHTLESLREDAAWIKERLQ
jgi:uncharacterized membrane protein YgdD (TMEM256/DUF423 family)